MDRKEWEELMEYLANEKVRRTRLRRKYLHRFEYEEHFWYRLDEVAEGYRRHFRSPDRKSDMEFEQNYIRSVRNLLNESIDLAEEVGMLEVLEDYEHLIREGMQFEDFPKEDAEVFRAVGELDPRGAMLAAFHKEKSRSSFYDNDDKYNDGPKSPDRSLRKGAEEINRTLDRIEEHTNDDMEHVTDGRARPSRRWFKGIGKIAQGSALTIADVCMAAGVLVLPVDASTQTWGAIVSSITGVGMSIEGIGEFRGE